MAVVDLEIVAVAAVHKLVVDWKKVRPYTVVVGAAAVGGMLAVALVAWGTFAAVESLVAVLEHRVQSTNLDYLLKQLDTVVGPNNEVKNALILGKFVILVQTKPKFWTEKVLETYSKQFI